MHEISRLTQKWRFRCPEGHTNWFPINGHFRCRSCAQYRNGGADDVKPEFDALHDQKTGEPVPREQVRLRTHERQRA